MDIEKNFIIYPLKAPKELWMKFKEVIPHSKNLNKSLLELIEEKIKKETKK